MRSERLWVLLLTAVSFLAGGAGGLLFGLELPRPDPPSFADCEERLVRQFDLNRRERTVLRQALREYHDEIEDLKSRGLADFEDDLIQSGRKCRERIRQHVLPDARREEFDTTVAGLPWPPADPTSD